MSIKKRVTKNLSPIQQMFANAIDYDALEKALATPKGKKEIGNILKKVRY